jgi:hypothetical protein
MNLKEARLAGSKRYTGSPCPTCGGVLRYVRNYECIGCRNAAKVKAVKKKRVARGPVKLGRPRKHPIKAVPKVRRKRDPKPVTDFEFWIRRSRHKKERAKIPYEVYKALYVTHCPLLGLKLTYTNFKGNTPANYASLDRIDSTKGYVEGNIQILSFRANCIKGDATLKEMQLLLKNWEQRA